MQKNGLKNIRVVLSLLFLSAVSILFVDVENQIVESWSGPFLYLQFVPSLLKFLYVVGIGTAGFIFVGMLTVIFGRVYCSSICPLGTFQDIVSFISKLFSKAKYKFIRPNNKSRYTILFLVVLLLTAGTNFRLLLLDPFSNFGRVLASFVRPVFVFLNNSLVFVLEIFDNYSLYPVEIKGFNFVSAIVPTILLVTIINLSYKYGRLYCNVICPVGTLLSIISRCSFFRVVINKVRCNGCGFCESVCKSECIDSDMKHIDTTRCVECFNCLGVCHNGSISFKMTAGGRISKRLSNNYTKSRRDFIRKIGIYFIGLSGLEKVEKKIDVYVENKTPVVMVKPISPPGSLSLEHFTDKCTSCHLCISSCPTQVLQPSFLHYGFPGILQPMLDYKKSFCNYNCTSCLNVCPTGAITSSPLEDKRLIQIGKAKFVEDNCVVKTQGTDCGACAEHCPTKAVRMVPYQDLRIPEVTDDICIGCGACEYACPSKPWKSIYVDSNIVHATAKKPLEDEIRKEDPEYDFPF